MHLEALAVSCMPVFSPLPVEVRSQDIISSKISSWQRMISAFTEKAGSKKKKRVEEEREKQRRKAATTIPSFTVEFSV